MEELNNLISDLIKECQKKIKENQNMIVALNMISYKLQNEYLKKKLKEKE